MMIQKPATRPKPLALRCRALTPERVIPAREPGESVNRLLMGAGASEPPLPRNARQEGRTGRSS